MLPNVTSDMFGYGPEYGMCTHHVFHIRSGFVSSPDVVLVHQGLCLRLADPTAGRLPLYSQMTSYWYSGIGVGFDVPILVNPCTGRH